MKRLISLALCLCLTIGLGAPATAIESDGMDVIVNDVIINLDTPVQVIDQVSYVSVWPVVQALYPDAAMVWLSDRVQIYAPGLTLEFQPGQPYFIANGRYLYLPEGMRCANGAILVPVRTLGTALGANVAWDPVGNDVVITAGYGPITPFDQAYPQDVLYWLSHIINAESGNQSLTGKIAVGNVVLNRVASSQFPNTVYEVIFQRHQFTPVANGTINLTPNEESVIAAKLCLDGANVIGNALFFLNPRTATSSWAARHRTYVATIGAHAFYL